MNDDKISMVVKIKGGTGLAIQAALNVLVDDPKEAKITIRKLRVNEGFAITVEYKHI